MIFKTAILILSMSMPSLAIECVAGSGCGNHLCLEKKEAETAMSTCEWRESYACYPKFGKCEVQENGKCGWTDSPQLNSCIKKADTSR